MFYGEKANPQLPINCPLHTQSHETQHAISTNTNKRNLIAVNTVSELQNFKNKLAFDEFKTKNIVAYSANQWLQHDFCNNLHHKWHLPYTFVKRH